MREVRETVPDGFKQAGEWSISAEQIADGAVLQYIVDNHAISTHLQIVKRDAQTGSAVPLAGFTFQLLDSNREPVSQTCWYPTHSVMNTFTTDKTGSVTLPESLRPGTYYIREKDAAAPYLRGEDLELSIPADMNLTPVAIASFYDQPAIGKIEIVKSDAVDGGALAGAVFEIRAAEDIVRPDGSMVALAGETVATIETDEQGKADIDGLSLGCGTAHYEVVEVNAPEGYLLDPTPHAVELTYADQDTPVIYARVDASNDYTKVDISKTDATDQAEIEGAQLTLLDANGETIETWTSTATPHRIERLAPGSYTLRETMSPRTYDTAEEVTFEVKETGDVQKVVMNDAPIEIKGRVDKRQEIAQPVASGLTANGDGKNRAATQSNAQGEFAYTIDARNESKTWVDEFTITDELECAAAGTARLVSVETPVAAGDYDGRCNIWYRTSPELEQDCDEQINATLSDGHENPWLETDEVKNLLGEDARLVDYDGWHLWKSNISTSESITLTVKDLNLPKDTQVTGLRIEYGSVSADFTTRSDASTWSREDLKDEHDDLDDAEASLDPQTHGALVHMAATTSYVAEKAIANGARVDLCRNGGGSKLEAHDEDHVIQRCMLPQNLPSTGSAPLAALMTALMTAGGAALWIAKIRSTDAKR